MAALQRHEYSEAMRQFQSLLSDFPEERALLDRARVYVELCRRELHRPSASPRTLEERLTMATAALNDGDDQAAERLAQEVLREHPNHDLALYLLAAVRARGGQAGSALEFLRQAVQIRPDMTAQARHDTDFDVLRDMDEFHQLVEDAAAQNVAGKTRRSPTRSEIR